MSEWSVFNAAVQASGSTGCSRSRVDMIQRMAGMIVIEAEKLAVDFRREQDAKTIIEQIVALIRQRTGCMG